MASPSIRPAAERTPCDPATLRARLLARQDPRQPFQYTSASDGTIVAEWRIADATWQQFFDRFRAVERYRATLALSPEHREVRVLEQRSGSRIRVDLEQFTSTKQTAIVSNAPQGITKSLEGWGGELKADGQTILVTPKTQVLFQPTKREKALLEFAPLSSLEQVAVGMAMTYEGRRHRPCVVLGEPGDPHHPR